MALLVYWSVIIFAPVIANEQSKYYDKIIYPKKNLISRSSTTNIKNAAVEKEFSSDESQHTREDNSSSSKNLPLGTFDNILCTCSFVI